MEQTKPKDIESKNNYADWQKQYQQCGYSVIPGKYGSKMPAIKNWSEYCYRLPTTDEVSSWIRNFDETNLDLALGEASGVVALDIDTDDKRILDVILPLLPTSPVVKKGSKGETRFFRYAGDMTDTLKFNNEMVIEILSAGKKTTLPPSRHPNGATYVWTSEQELIDFNKNELPILPPALFANLAQILHTKLPDLAKNGYNKLTSGRNDTLSSFCGLLIASNAPLGEAVSALIAKDNEINEPPLFSDQNEFQHTEPVTNALLFYTNHLNSINKKHYRESKTYEVPLIPKTDSNEVVTGDREEGKCQGARSVKDIMQLAPIALKNLHTNLLNNSWVKQPDLALGALLSLTATLVSRKVVFQGLSPNLYVLNISPSGSGKDKPQSYVKEILINMRADSLLGSGDYVSDASLMDGLANKPVRLDILDEAGGILRSVNSGKSEYNGKMADVLAELYTSSNTKYLGRSTAEGNKGACYRPNVNILASTTPTGFSEGVSRKAIEKGLMGRFLVFLGDSGAESKRLRSFPKPPESALEQLKFWHGFRVEDWAENAAELELGGITQTFIELEANRGAETRLDEIFAEFDEKRRKTEPSDPKLPIISRLYQQMVKIVIISACMRSQNVIPIIQKADVEFGYEVIKYYFGTIGKVVDKYVFENKTQMESQRMLNILDDFGGFMTQTQLVRATRTLTKNQREAIIEDLILSGLLVREYESVDGEQQITYRSKQ